MTSPIICRFPFVVMLFVLASCNEGVHYKELGEGCYFLVYSREISHVTCPYTRKLGVYGEISAFNYDADFIIVRQRPSKSAHTSLLFIDLFAETKDKSKEEALMCHRKADSLIDNDEFFVNVLRHPVNYWIISRKEKKLLGPYNEVEYTAMCKQLNIQQKLKGAEYYQ